MGNIHVILNLDQWFRRRCCLKKKFTDDEQRPITIAYHEGSGELKKIMDF